MTLVTELVRVSDRGLGRPSRRQCGIAALDKEISHFQTFGMEVVIFTE